MAISHHDIPSNPGGKFRAILRGKGAIAQALQQAIAVASRGIYIGGANSGIVNTGFQLIVNNYRATSSNKLGKRALGKALQTYLEWMHNYCNDIGVFADTTSITAYSDRSTRIELDRIFVPLKVSELGVENPRSASCEHLLSFVPNRNIVLLADAGQGKSIALLNLARQLCGNLLTKRGWEDIPSLKRSLGFSQYKDLAIPFYLPLNVFAESLKKDDIGLKVYLDRQLQRESFQLPSDFFSVLIENDKPIVILLDGLDEVLDIGSRERVSEHLRNLSHGK